MLYPGSFLLGECARADHLNVGVPPARCAGHGAKVVHLAPNTTSNILAKSISEGRRRAGLPRAVRMDHNSKGSSRTCSATG